MPSETSALRGDPILHLMLVPRVGRSRRQGCALAIFGVFADRPRLPRRHDSAGGANWGDSATQVNIGHQFAPVKKLARVFGHSFSSDALATVTALAAITFARPIAALESKSPYVRLPPSGPMIPFMGPLCEEYPT